MENKFAMKHIPPSFHLDIWQKHEHGFSVDYINEYLVQNNVVVDNRTIYRTIARIKEEKREITQAIYANEVLMKAHSDLQIVDDMILNLYANFQDRMDTNDHKNAIAYANSLEKYLSFRKNLMMGDEKLTDAPKDKIINSLLDKLLNEPNITTNISTPKQEPGADKELCPETK